MAWNMSAAKRRALVALQLRDKNGRFIDMGKSVKWFSAPHGKVVSGTVEDGKDTRAIVRMADGPDKGKLVYVQASQIEVIDSKATLAPKDGPSADQTPEVNAPDAVAKVDTPESKKDSWDGAYLSDVSLTDMAKMPEGTILANTSSSGGHFVKGSGDVWQQYLSTGSKGSLGSSASIKNHDGFAKWTFAPKGTDPNSVKATINKSEGTGIPNPKDDPAYEETMAKYAPPAGEFKPYLVTATSDGNTYISAMNGQELYTPAKELAIGDEVIAPHGAHPQKPFSMGKAWPNKKAERVNTDGPKIGKVISIKEHAYAVVQLPEGETVESTQNPGEQVNSVTIGLSNKVIKATPELKASLKDVIPEPKYADTEAPAADAPDKAKREKRLSMLKSVQAGSTVTSKSEDDPIQFTKQDDGSWTANDGSGVHTPETIVDHMEKNPVGWIMESPTASLEPVGEVSEQSVTDQELLSKMYDGFAAELAKAPKLTYSLAGKDEAYGAFDGFNDVEVEAISEYVGSSVLTNSALRNGKIDNNQIGSIVLGMDNILDRSVLQEDTKVFRGVGATTEMLDKILSKGIMHDRAFTSTTVDSDFADSWVANTGSAYATPVIMEINLPKGFKAHKVDYAVVGNGFDHENEVVLPRDLDFDITDVQEYTNASGQKGYRVQATPILNEKNYNTGAINGPADTADSTNGADSTSPDTGTDNSGSEALPGEPEDGSVHDNAGSGLVPQPGGSGDTAPAESGSEDSDGPVTKEDFKNLVEDLKAQLEGSSDEAPKSAGLRRNRETIMSELEPLDTSAWKKVGGQKGSNAGGVFEDESGQQWYVKQAKSEAHARAEVLADQLYKAAGIDSSGLKLTQFNGKLGTASPMIEGAKSDLGSKLHSDKAYMDKVREGFAVDAWLANWDVLGLGNDNIVTDSNGNPVRIDTGGTMMFRAQGGLKNDQQPGAWGNEVKDWDGLRQQGEAQQAFKNMTDQQLVDSAARVEAVTPEEIDAMVDALGWKGDEAVSLKDTLKARRDDIIKKASELGVEKSSGNAPEAPQESTMPSQQETTPEAPEADQPKAVVMSRKVSGHLRSELEMLHESALESGLDEGYDIKNGKLEIYDLDLADKALANLRDILDDQVDNNSENPSLKAKAKLARDNADMIRTLIKSEKGLQSQNKQDSEPFEPILPSSKPKFPKGTKDNPNTLTGYTIEKNERGVYYPTERLSMSAWQGLRNGTIVPPNLPFIPFNTTSGEVHYWDSTGVRHWGQFGGEGALTRRKNANGEFEYLLAQRGADLSTSPNMWSTPGGAHALESDSKANGLTAKIELEEELGFEVHGEPVANYKHATAPDWGYNYAIFDAPEGTDVSLENVDRHEIQDMKWLTADQIRELRDNGQLQANMAEVLDDVLNASEAVEKDVPETTTPETDSDAPEAPSQAAEDASSPDETDPDAAFKEQAEKFTKFPEGISDEDKKAAIDAAVNTLKMMGWTPDEGTETENDSPESSAPAEALPAVDTTGPSATMADGNKAYVGSRVAHEQFGYGTVIQIIAGKSAKIEFDDGLTKISQSHKIVSHDKVAAPDAKVDTANMVAGDVGNNPANGKQYILGSDKTPIYPGDKVEAMHQGQVRPGVVKGIYKSTNSVAIIFDGESKPSTKKAATAKSLEEQPEVEAPSSAPENAPEATPEAAPAADEKFEGFNEEGYTYDEAKAVEYLEKELADAYKGGPGNVEAINQALDYLYAKGEARLAGETEPEEIPALERRVADPESAVNAPEDATYAEDAPEEEAAPEADTAPEEAPEAPQEAAEEAPEPETTPEPEAEASAFPTGTRVKRKSGPGNKQYYVLGQEGDTVYAVPTSEGNFERGNFIDEKTMDRYKVPVSDLVEVPHVGNQHLKDGWESRFKEAIDSKARPEADEAEVPQDSDATDDNQALLDEVATMFEASRTPASAKSSPAGTSVSLGDGSSSTFVKTADGDWELNAGDFNTGIKGTDEQIQAIADHHGSAFVPPQADPEVEAQWAAQDAALSALRKKLMGQDSESKQESAVKVEDAPATPSQVDDGTESLEEWEKALLDGDDVAAEDMPWNKNPTWDSTPDPEAEAALEALAKKIQAENAADSSDIWVNSDGTSFKKPATVSSENWAKYADWEKEIVGEEVKPSDPLDSEPTAEDLTPEPETSAPVEVEQPLNPAEYITPDGVKMYKPPTTSQSEWDGLAGWEKELVGHFVKPTPVNNYNSTQGVEMVAPSGSDLDELYPNAKVVTSNPDEHVYTMVKAGGSGYGDSVWEDETGFQASSEELADGSDFKVISFGVDEPVADAPEVSEDSVDSPLSQQELAIEMAKFPIGTKVGDPVEVNYVKTNANLWEEFFGDEKMITEFSDSEMAELAEGIPEKYSLDKFTIPEGSSLTDLGIAENGKLSGLTKDEFKALPIGSKVVYSATGGSDNPTGTYEKTHQGLWKYTASTEGAVPKEDLHSDIFDHLFEDGTDTSKYTLDGAKASTETVAPEPEVISSPAGVENHVNLSGNVAALDSLPPGSTVKKEMHTNYYYHNDNYWVKQPDGSWQEYKKTAMKTMKGNLTTSSGLTGLGKVTISKPISEKNAVLATGELAYEGDTVYDAGQEFTIEKINKTSIVVTDSEGNKIPKKPHALKKNIEDWGKPEAPSAPYYGPVDPLTKSAKEHAAEVQKKLAAKLAAEKLVKDLEVFSGASSDDYDAQGVTMASNPAPKTDNGLTVLETGEPDKDHPLYGTPKPVAPADENHYPPFTPPAADPLPKWDSEKWLDKVKQRYLDNPNKAKSSLEESNKWGQVQEALSGSKSSLEALKNSMYLDDALYNEAIEGIDAQEKANTSLKAKIVKDAKDAKDAYDAQKAIDLADLTKAKQNYQTKLEEWLKANPSTDSYKQAKKPPVSTESFEAGEADWTKAHIGTYTAQAVMDSIRDDNVLGTHGLSIATDSDQIEDLDVKVTKVLDKSGVEKFEMKFKLTAPYGKAFEHSLKQDSTVEVSDTIYPSHMVKDPVTGLMKDAGKPIYKFLNQGSRYTFTDPMTGAVIVFQKSSDYDGFNISSNDNTVKIHMPIDSTPEMYQQTLENMGIKKARPSTSGDIKVLAENKLLTMMGEHMGGVKSFDGRVNISGEDRKKSLAKIKDLYGITPEDLTFSTEPNGRVRFYLDDDKASELAKKYNVSYFRHQVSGSGDVDRWVNMLGGSNPGMLSTYHRFTEGIGGEGKSSSEDMSDGAGDYNYLTPQGPNNEKPTSRTGLVIKPSAVFKRMDFWANPGDGWGKKAEGGSTSNKAPYKLFDQQGNIGYSGYGGGGVYEVLPKDTVPLSDFAYVVIGDSVRADVIKKLQEKGILEINGLPLDQFIIPVNGTPPVDLSAPGLV